MAACNSLKAHARQCAKNTKSGIRPDVYLIAFDDLSNITGTTEVFTEALGLITAIHIANTATNVFVKYGAVVNQSSIKEDYTQSENGTFDIVKELMFSLTSVGNADANSAVEDLFGLPVVALIKLQSGTWVVIGLNGQFQIKTSAGAVDKTSNGRVITLSGSDDVLIRPVDPTIINALITTTA